ncbi:YjcZ family sporulation protein [Bacillus sp. JJ1562]
MSFDGHSNISMTFTLVVVLFVLLIIVGVSFI